jgi:hypothetical protein
MLAPLSVGPLVDKPCIWRPNLFHTYETTIIRDTDRTRVNATNLIHEFNVVNTCKPAIAALAGSILVVFGRETKCMLVLFEYYGVLPHFSKQNDVWPGFF